VHITQYTPHYSQVEVQLDTKNKDYEILAEQFKKETTLRKKYKNELEDLKGEYFVCIVCIVCNSMYLYVAFLYYLFGSDVFGVQIENNFLALQRKWVCLCGYYWHSLCEQN